MAFTITHFTIDDAVQIAAAHALRFAVFCDEQGVPVALEMDGRDPEGLHFLLYEEQVPIATARTRLIEPGIRKIERMAVTQGCRRRGAGRALMEAILDRLRALGGGTAILHAQTPVEVFYRRLGFISEGEVYLEAGLPHRTMRLDLDNVTVKI